MKRKPPAGPPPPPGAKTRAKTQRPRPKTQPLEIKQDETSPVPFDQTSASLRDAARFGGAEPFDDEIDQLAIAALDPNNRSGALKVAPRQSTFGGADSFQREDSVDIDVALDSFDHEESSFGDFAVEVRSEPRVLESERAVSLGEDEIVAETPELPVLRVAICETHGHLAGAQAATTAAGHEVVIGAAGVDGAGKVMDVMRRDGVDVVIVALPGVGDARGGIESQVIDAALALEPRRPIVIASLPGTAADSVRRAHLAGADLLTQRPHEGERLAPILMAAARLSYERERAANAKGAETVLRQKLEEVAEPGGLEPLELFQRNLETEIKRARRYEYPLAVAMFAVEIEPPPPPAGVRGILRARIGNILVRTIRDIDVATQLDHERFLVLLPYTDLTGATNVARRIIDTIRIGDPVVAAGRTFPPRVVGAVASAGPGQQMSFSKLVRDASRALDQARRDGAELAVQP